ncbi:MAG TPA: uroporphyrinogen decarboxylase family protein, partial [Verrucomicrobiae bacterium]|nr:uroporphyrinogen decarboxylase family protein [Verrucomicrobiae bacterium]
MNQQFQNALKSIPQAVPPIWFMRQAGRYHDHYQALKRDHSFVELCKVPELAAETAMGPIRDFDFDVSIFFSDLLFPLEALGMGLEYSPGPKLGWQLREESDLKRLRPVAEALPHLEFQRAALAATRAALPATKSLLGFVGGPWTLFTYAVAGGHSGDLRDVKERLHLFAPFCESAELERRLDAYLAPFVALSPAERAGWVCGLGHGVLQHTPQA